MSNPGTILYPPASVTTRFNARPVDYPVLSAPIPGVKTNYVLRQPFSQWGNSRTPLDLGTLYVSDGNFAGATLWNDLAGFILVEETEPSSIGGGFVQWTRTFAKVPDRHVEPTTCNGDFPAFYPGTTVITNGVPADPLGRAAFSADATGLMIFDYAEVNEGDDIDTELPLIPAQTYGYIRLSNSKVIDYATADQLRGAGTFGPLNTYPTLEDYKAWVAQTAGNDGNPAIVNGTDFGEAYKFYIVPQVSQRDRWMGNIYRRQTILIRPQ